MLSLGSIIIFPVYTALAVYVFLRGRMWLRAIGLKHRAFAVCFAAVLIFLCLSPALAIPFEGTVFHMVMKRISNLWIGAMLYVLLGLAVIELSRLVLRFTRYKGILKSRKALIASGVAALTAASAVTVYGSLHARDISVTNYYAYTDKSCPDIKAVLISDLHLGYSIGYKHIAKMTEKINEQNPDIIFIAGDIFDNDFSAVSEPEKISALLRGMHSKYGVYACWGNHDIQEKILAGFSFTRNVKAEDNSRMLDFLEQSGITLLNDEAVLIDNSFYVVGRADYSKSKKEAYTRKTPEELLSELDKTKPVIVIDHQPKDLSELAAAGADADLCGHTHDGQLFPGTLTIKLVWENSYGYMRKGKMHSIVSSGAGIWGPYMRVDSDNEICVINFSFNS